MGEDPTVVEIIRGALPLVENPKTWTTHETARDRRVFVLSPTSATAVRFCGIGALEKAAFDLTHDRAVAERLTIIAVDELTILAGCPSLADL